MAWQRERGRGRKRDNPKSDGGKARELGGTHLQARAYLSQQPEQVHKGKVLFFLKSILKVTFLNSKYKKLQEDSKHGKAQETRRQGLLRLSTWFRILPRSLSSVTGRL